MTAHTERPTPAWFIPTSMLIALALIAASIAAMAASTAVPAAAQPGTIDLGGGLGRPGEPAPVDMTAVSNTPLQGQWGVTGLDPNRTVNYDTEVWDFAVIGERIYVAGAFLNVQRNRDATPISRPYLAAFDLYTGEWDPGFQPQLDGSVWALEVSPRNTLLVGGEFTSVEGRPNTEGLTSLDPVTGAYDTEWAGSVERPWATERAVVRSLEVVGNALYVGGNFSHVRGATQSQRTRVFKVARVDARSGTPDATFKPEVTGAGVWGFGIDTENQMMHLTGFFSSVGGGANTNSFASVDLVTGALRTDLVPFQRNSTIQQDMFDVEVGAAKIWAGGSEHIVHVMDDATRTLLGWHTTGFQSPDNFTWTIPGRINFAGGDYQVIEEVGDFVIAGCHCNEEEGRGILSHYSSFDDARFRTLMVEAYEGDTGRLVSTFVPDLASSIEGAWAIHSDGLGCLLVGGDFELGGLKTGSAFWLGNFARFCPPGLELGPDTESPSIPTNVIATSPGDEGTESVTITWDPSTDNRSVVGYDVFRDGTVVATVDDTTFTDTGLAAGTYGYRIQAIDSSDNRSAGSPTVSATVAGPDTDPPTLPTNLQANANGNDVTLTWDPSTDPSGLDGYAVYRNGAYIGWATTPTYTDTGLPNGTYTYSLRAYDNLGNRTARAPSTPSPSAHSTPTRRPCPPTSKQPPTATTSPSPGTHQPTPAASTATPCTATAPTSAGPPPRPTPTPACPTAPTPTHSGPTTTSATAPPANLRPPHPRHPRHRPADPAHQPPSNRQRQRRHPHLEPINRPQRPRRLRRLPQRRLHRLGLHRELHGDEPADRDLHLLTPGLRQPRQPHRPRHLRPPRCRLSPQALLSVVMRPVVLVHGAWHGAWCWEHVQPLLTEADVESVAVHLPFTGLADDAATVADTLDVIGRASTEPAVLVGHSYGGMVISEAAAGRDDIGHLVYLCALMLRAGQTTAEGSDGLDTALAGTIDVADDLGSTIIAGAAAEAFYADAPADLAAAAAARLRRFPIDSLGTVTGEPWRAIPSTYVVCTEDRAIHPAHQRFMAQSAETLIEWPTAHSPFLSHPQLVADLLVELASR